jgi:hypothetical protein
MDWMGLDAVPGAGIALSGAGLALAIVGDVLIFA